MATVLFFAQARQAAGRRSFDAAAATTVGEAIDAAITAFGPELGAIVAHCKIWKNGEPAGRDVSLGANDEVALLPPVSGG